MNAEKRSRFLELYFHIVLALFALASIGTSVMGSAQQVRPNESILSFAAITTLCLSLLIFGFKFGETAANHRSCYLSLQKLRAGPETDHHKLEEAYIEILGHYPNHTTGDYMRLAISNMLKDEQRLESPDGSKVEIGWWQRLSYSLTWALSRILFIAFAVMPFALAWYGIDFINI